MYSAICSLIRRVAVGMGIPIGNPMEVGLGTVFFLWKIVWEWELKFHSHGNQANPTPRCIIRNYLDST